MPIFKGNIDYKSRSTMPPEYANDAAYESAHGVPTVQAIYFNTTSNKYRWHDGAGGVGWQDLGAGGDPSIWEKLYLYNNWGGT